MLQSCDNSLQFDCKNLVLDKFLKKYLTDQKKQIMKNSINNYKIRN